MEKKGRSWIVRATNRARLVCSVALLSAGIVVAGGAIQAAPASAVVNYDGIVSTTTALVPSSTALAWAQQVTFTATVTPANLDFGTPTGSIEFNYDGNLQTTVALDGSGVALWTTNASFFGTKAVTATYVAAGHFDGSLSATVNVTSTLPAPTNVTATAGVKSATVAWMALSPLVESPTIGAQPVTASLPVIRYAVTAHDLTTGTTGTPVDEGTATSATLAGLIVGDGYNFTVTATMGFPDVAPQIQTPVITHTSLPSAPSNTIVPTSSAPQDTATGATSAGIGQSGVSGSVHATASGGTGSVVVSTYAGDPTGGFIGGGSFFDVKLTPGSTFTSMTITLCGISSANDVKWWKPITLKYQTVSNVAPGSSVGCFDITINAGTTPSISQMYSTVLVVSTSPALASTGQQDRWMVPTGLSLILAGAALLLIRCRQLLSRRAH